MGEFTGSEAGLDPQGQRVGAPPDMTQQKVDEMKQQAQDGLARLRETAGDYQAQAREQLQRMDAAVIRFTRSNPLAAVGGALVAGFIIGRLGNKL